jgi:hypothetical protein
LNEKITIAVLFGICMNKKRLVVSYQNLSEDLLDALKKRYPNGYGDSVMKISGPNDKVFYAVMLDTQDASYLVKVDVKIDSVGEELEGKAEFEEEDYTSAASEETTTFGSDEEDFENIPDTEE